MQGIPRSGRRSTAHWLNRHCGLSMPAARERVRVARALDERLPLVEEVFAAGRVTYSKVRAITRVVTAATETMLVELALAGTATHLDRICSAYRRVRRHDHPRSRHRRGRVPPRRRHPHHQPHARPRRRPASPRDPR
ncbi:MAG: DUF222 domain-containing protein [Acidimicrobiales bacterium]